MIETCLAPDNMRRGSVMLLVVIAFSLGMTAGYALRTPGDSGNAARLHGPLVPRAPRRATP